MKKGTLVLSALAVTALALLVAGPSSAHPVEGLAGDAAASPSPAPVARSEATGTATASPDGSSITITTARGSMLTCAVPVGIDLTPFLTGPVKAECELVGGVLTVGELKAADGAAVEVRDDGTVEVDEDAGELEADDDLDDNSGPGAVDNSGPSDNSGPGTADEGGHDGGSGGHDGGDDGDHGGSGGGDD